MLLRITGTWKLVVLQGQMGRERFTPIRNWTTEVNTSTCKQKIRLLRPLRNDSPGFLCSFCGGTWNRFDFSTDAKESQLWFLEWRVTTGTTNLLLKFGRVSQLTTARESGAENMVPVCPSTGGELLWLFWMMIFVWFSWFFGGRSGDCSPRTRAALMTEYCDCIVSDDY